MPASAAFQVIALNPFVRGVISSTSVSRRAKTRCRVAPIARGGPTQPRCLEKLCTACQAPKKTPVVHAFDLKRDQLPTTRAVPPSRDEQRGKAMTAKPSREARADASVLDQENTSTQKYRWLARFVSSTAKSTIAT